MTESPTHPTQPSLPQAQAGSDPWHRDASGAVPVLGEPPGELRTADAARRLSPQEALSAAIRNKHRQRRRISADYRFPESDPGEESSVVTTAVSKPATALSQGGGAAAVRPAAQHAAPGNGVIAGKTSPGADGSGPIWAPLLVVVVVVAVLVFALLQMLTA